jgi:hypothetical protein
VLFSAEPVKPGETSVLQELLTLWRKPPFCKSVCCKELRRTKVRFLLKLLSSDLPFAPNRGFERSSMNPDKAGGNAALFQNSQPFGKAN